MKFVEPAMEAQINLQQDKPDQFNNDQPPLPPMEIKKGFKQEMRYFRAFRSVFFILLVLAVGTSIRITSQWYNNEKLRKETENEKLNAELSFLKSQINPHFFFNTLNSIYSLASKKSDKTPEAIIKLSQLMRYIIYDSEKELVPLQNEIDYINNLVELQKLRLKNNVKVLFITQGLITNKWIEPLLLLPFIENAFKHGIDYTKECTIAFSIVIKDEQLFFESENPLVTQFYQLKDNENSGIGLLNSKKRLSLLYPGKHSLIIDENNGKFKVNLQLTFKTPPSIEHHS